MESDGLVKSSRYHFESDLKDGFLLGSPVYKKTVFKTLYSFKLI